MKKQSRWGRFMADSKMRQGIALGIAIMSIGYNMLPLEPSVGTQWACGLILFFAGAWFIVSSSSVKSEDT
jgi:hypothetical protein